jgi:long-chain acyl-CoA synthetase
VDEHGCPLGVGETGEVVARGSNIMKGYWKDPDLTSQVLQKGYYHTGDLGYMDEEGFIFLTGRAREMIKVGGNRVGAKEVEETLLQFQEVYEAAVIGVPDEILGEAIVAFIVPKNGAFNRTEFEQFVRKTLPTFKQPKRIEIVKQLPKNQAGKVLKAKLIEMDSAADVEGSCN